jgi:hypothetical protein
MMSQENTDSCTYDCFDIFAVVIKITDFGRPPMLHFNMLETGETAHENPHFQQILFTPIWFPRRTDDSKRW